MLVVGDRRVMLMEESIKMSKDFELDFGSYFEFVRVTDGTIRSSFLEVEEIINKGDKSLPEKIVIVCGIDDVITSEFTTQGKRMLLNHPTKNETAQAMRLQKHVDMFEKRLTALVGDQIQVVWIIPHPVDVETHLRLNLKRSCPELPPDHVLHGRFLTKLLNGTFQKWEGYLRQHQSRIIVPWFIKFVSEVPGGSQKFSAFMKSVRASDRCPNIAVQSLIPEAVPDGFNPSHSSIMKILKTLKGLRFFKSKTCSLNAITKEEVVVGQSVTVSLNQVVTRQFTSHKTELLEQIIDPVKIELSKVMGALTVSNKEEIDNIETMEENPICNI